MSSDILEKTLARLASTAALRCLMLAHLECPACRGAVVCSARSNASCMVHAAARPLVAARAPSPAVHARNAAMVLAAAVHTCSNRLPMNGNGRGMAAAAAAAAAGGVLSADMVKRASGHYDLETVRRLKLAGLSLRDVSVLAECKSLVALDLRDNLVRGNGGCARGRQGAPPRRCGTAVRTERPRLSLQITDLSPLSMLDSLTALDVSGNRISSLRAFRAPRHWARCHASAPPPTRHGAPPDSYPRLIGAPSPQARCARSRLCGT